MSVETVNKPSLSFPRQWIFKKADTFRSLYRNGRRLRGEIITIFFRPAGDDCFQVGFTTRKKLAHAVGRNRARRLMRETVRLHQHEIRKDIQCLFLWHGPVKGVGFSAAEGEIMELLRRGGLLK